MNVRIEDTSKKIEIEAIIENSSKSPIPLPSIREGWRFDFKRQAKKPNRQTYVLYQKETPEVIEGCLIFEMKD
jgi:hypothetical protein